MKKIILIFFLFSFLSIKIFSQGRYLIITADTFYNAIQDLALWKHQKGMMCKVTKLSEIGSSPSNIKNYIVNAYNNWNPRPEYLLLVGSPEFLPSYYSSASGIYTDNYYADMTGDYRAEISYGRLPCRTLSQCSLMVRKILIYEKEPFISDSFWMRKGVGIVREDNDPPDDSIYWSDIRLSFQLMGEVGFIQIDTFSLSRGNNANNVINSVNNGRGVVFYRGQGVGNWYSPFNVNPALTNNYGEYPIIGSFTCQTLTLAPNESMVGERWLWVGTYNNPVGAVAFFGNTHSASNVAAVRSAAIRGFIRAFFSDSFKLGKACLSAKESIYVRFSYRAEYEGFNLLGDPELNLWTGRPETLAVLYPETIKIGAQNVLIRVFKNGEPLPNALVCLWKGEEVYAYKYTNSLGYAPFNINPQTPGEMILTVTTKNSLPFIKRIYVILRDVSVTNIISPPSLIDSGTIITPACSIYNYGTVVENYSVIMKIGNFYDCEIFVNNHQPNTKIFVSFPSHQNWQRGYQLVACSTKLQGDLNPANDKLTCSTFVRVLDVQTSSIEEPKGIVNKNTVIQPKAKIKNNGNTEVNFSVRFYIDNGYEDSQEINLLPMEEREITFSSWTPQKTGYYLVKCSTELFNDMNNLNDKKEIRITVIELSLGWHRMTDIVGASKPVKSGGAVCALGNKVYSLVGNNTRDLMVYDVDIRNWIKASNVPQGPKNKNVKKGASICTDGQYIYVVKGNNTQEFARFNPANDEWKEYQIGFSKGIKGSSMAYDGDSFIYIICGSSNNEWKRFNRYTETFEPCNPASLPADKWKTGSWIVYVNGNIYALRVGGKINEFYMIPIGGTGERKAEMPLIGSTGKKKKAKEGSAGAYNPDNKLIYALKGGNTQEFFSYNPATDQWTILEDIPSSKKVKGGGSLTYSTAQGSLYAFPGNNLNEFWLYIPGGAFWANAKPSGNIGIQNETKNLKNFTLNLAPTRDYLKFFFALPVNTKATLKIYDTAGNLIYSGITDKDYFVIDKKRFATGIYIIKFAANEYKTTSKLIIY